jgi:hypothetical protein
MNRATITEKLQKAYLRGEITIVQASWAIYKAGLRHTPPDEFQTLKLLGIY